MPEQPTNGPYHWGNPPKPEGFWARVLRKLAEKKKGNK